jgi:beta-N-acetylhexosaminidase
MPVKYFLLLLILLLGCNQRNKADTVNEFDVMLEEPAVDARRILARETAASLDDRLLAAQLLICGIDGKASLPEHIVTLLRECPAGGIILFRYNLNTDFNSTRNLIREISSLISKEAQFILPFISVDHEGGEVNRFPEGIAALPPAYSYWEYAQENGRQTALEKIEADSQKAAFDLSVLGINLNFAPVAEILNDDNRVFFSRRTYGSDPVFIADAAAAFIRGMESMDILCAVKHFPGTAGADPHLTSSVLNGNKETLTELVAPFTAIFDRGARAVMIAHTAVPALDNEIASLSKIVMQNWLRGELGFAGIVICDDFSMAAAKTSTISTEEAVIRSISAGADMVLVWPPDIQRTHRAVIAALQDGRLSRDRLLDAVERIIYEKNRLWLSDEQ